MTLVWSHYGNLAVFVYVVCVMNIQILLNSLHPCLSFIGDCSLQLRVFLPKWRSHFVADCLY